MLICEIFIFICFTQWKYKYCEPYHSGKIQIWCTLSQCKCKYCVPNIVYHSGNTNIVSLLTVKIRFFAVKTKTKMNVNDEHVFVRQIRMPVLQLILYGVLYGFYSAFVNAWQYFQHAFDVFVGRIFQADT